MFSLAGKVAVVTGGTGVLGSHICRGLSRADAAVAVLGTSAERTAELAHELNRSGGSAIGLSTDVLNRQSLQAAADQIVQHFGRVDILVNAAGGNKPEGTTSADRPFFDLAENEVQWVFNLNFLGTFLPSQVFGSIMADQKSGTIVNISSMASFHPMTRVVAYSAAKAAVNNFTEWLAIHFAAEYSPNIRVNAIAPGFFMTGQNRFLLVDSETGELTERGHKIIEHTPMARFGEPDDLIGTVIWLVSDASRFVTGVVVPVDGGFNAYSGV